MDVPSMQQGINEDIHQRIQTGWRKIERNTTSIEHQAVNIMKIAVNSCTYMNAIKCNYFSIAIKLEDKNLAKELKRKQFPKEFYLLLSHGSTLALFSFLFNKVALFSISSYNDIFQ